MKIFHFADLHLDQVTRENVLFALDRLLEAAREERPDLIVNAGDLAWKRGSLAPWVALRLRAFHVALAAIAPVIVVAGNHDLAAPGEPGTVLGALDLSAGERNIHLIEEGCYVRLSEFGVPSGFGVLCLPYPSRATLLAEHPELKGSDINAALSESLVESLRAANRAITAPRAILVYHGSLVGARLAGERQMPTEQDVVLDESQIPARFEAVLCGHIHRPQVIGRAAYPGSPAPLTFGEEQHGHGYVVWDDASGRLLPELRELPVLHRLLTIDRRGQSLVTGATSLPELFEQNGIDPALIPGARVRFMATVAPELAGFARSTFGSALAELGAHDVRLIFERPGRDHGTEPQVDPDATIGHLLDLYARRRPDLEDLIGPVKDVASRVEADLPPAVRVRAASGGYRLLSLAWDNFKSYGMGNTLRLADCGRLVAIEGDNASGKSNASEVECFALYGRVPRGRVALADLVRQGESAARVEAEFEAAGERWRVVRRLKVNSKGVGSSDVDLFQFEASNGAWKPATVASSREADALVSDLVGPIELYLSTRFASQGEIDRLLDLTPAELKDTLQSVLSTEIFAEREALGRLLAAERERARDHHEAGLVAWREEAGMLEQRGSARTDAEAALARSRTALEQATREREKAEINAESAAARLADYEKALERWEAIEKALEDATAALSRAERQLAEDRALSAEGEAAGHRQGVLPARRAELAHLESARDGRDRLRAEAERCRQNVSRARRALEARRDLMAERLVAAEAAVELHGRRVAERERAAEREIKQIEASIRAVLDAHERDFRSAERRAGLVEQAPFGERCVSAGCPLLADAVGARAELPALTDAIDIARQKGLAAINEARARHRDEAESLAAEGERLTGAVSALTGQPDAEIPALESALGEAQDEQEAADSAARAAEVNDLSLERLRREIAELEALAGQVALGREAAGRLPLREQIAADARAAALAAEDQHRAATRPDPESLAEEKRLADERLAAAAEAERLARLVVERCSQDLADARARLEQAERARARLAEASGESARLELELRAARTYLEAVGRDGIPYLMLERSLPALEAHANHFLCEDQGSGLRIEVEGLRELRSGEKRSDVVIRYSNPFGTHPLSAASGMERVAIGYALRAALALVQAEAQGVTIHHLIADEGWGVFDESNLLTIGQPMVRRLAERFGRVILISHQAPIRAVCDTRLRVTADAEHGSRIEVAA